jgi:hypothetical protein
MLKLCEFERTNELEYLLFEFEAFVELGCSCRLDSWGRQCAEKGCG